MREKFRFRSCVLSGRVSFRIRAHLSSDIRFVCEWFLCAIELFNSNCFESCNAHMFTAPLLHKQFEYSLRESTPLLAARLLLFIAFAIKNRIRKVEVCEIGGARANTKLSPARAAKNEQFAQTNNNWNGTHTPIWRARRLRGPQTGTFMNMSTCCLSLRCIRCYDVVTRRVLREKRWSSKSHFPPPTSNPWKSFVPNAYLIFVYIFNDVHGWKSAHFLQPRLIATDARVAFIRHMNFVWSVCVCALGSIPMAMFMANDAMIAPIDIIVECLARWLCIAARFARTLILHLVDKIICARINDNWIYYVRNACAERRRAINLFCFAFRDVRMHASICNNCKWKHALLRVLLGIYTFINRSRPAPNVTHYI